MTTKIITLDDYFNTGEPTVQLISTRGRNGRVLREQTSLHKVASIKSPAMDYINSIEPEEGKSIVLIVGLGDHETYGPNRNGDGFPSKPVPGKIASEQVLPKHYQSYDNAHVYEHHANTDPSKAIGRVKKAFWNPHMRRVEVVEDFTHSKAPRLLEKIAAGDYPAKSMGCRIKYDVCTNCSNKARTRAEYCDHLKYAMNEIDPNSGIQNAALNPSPDFFDSSWVIRPADRTGYMLKKIAAEAPYEIRTSSYELGELRDAIVEKAAAIAKAADIEKILEGKPEMSLSSLDDTDQRLLSKYQDTCGLDESVGTDPGIQKTVHIMIKYKPKEALGTSEAMGLPLGVENIIRYFVDRMSGDPAPCGCDSIKSASHFTPTIVELFTAFPRFYADVVKLGKLDEPYTVNEELATKLAALAPRSVTEDYFYRKHIPEDFREDERGNTDVMSWTDPTTGRAYNTNYGNVRNMNDTLVQHGLKRKALQSGSLLGTGALLGGAALALSRRGPLGLWNKKPLTALGLGATGAGLTGLGAHKLMSKTPTVGPKIRTDQGETISGWTEMAPKTGAALVPELHYLRHRMVDGPHTKTGCDKRLLTHLSKFTVRDDHTELLGPTLDLNKVAQVLGDAILRTAS